MNLKLGGIKLRHYLNRKIALCLIAILMSGLLLPSSVISNAASAEVIPESILERENINITSGNFYNLSGDIAAGTIYDLTEGSIFIEYNSTSTGQYQSLFSVSNSTTGNANRYFHIYVTPSGGLGMELRNTDGIFKYTTVAPNTVVHGQTNMIAFAADPTTNSYKLFANGSLVATLNQTSFKFLSDITGLDRITLGGTVRADGNNQYEFGGTINKVVIYEEALSDTLLADMTLTTSVPPAVNILLDKSDISITSGSKYDLSSESSATQIKTLDEGTILISYTSTSTAGIQTLFSIGNSTSGNANRHFHVYITNTGLLGMELRNTDTEFKYTLNRPASLQGKYHGENAVNTVAFKADKTSGSYKLFANGELVATLDSSSYKFVNDITGVDNIALGATARSGSNAYPFGGMIHNVKVYDGPLSDEALIQATAVTTYGTKVFHSDDSTNANYYRIPAMLTLKSGTVVSSIDARYGGTHDARSNIDIAFSKSLDGGETWSQPSLPLVFDDYEAQAVEWPRDAVGKNVQISKSAAFIDSVLMQDSDSGRLFLFADAFPSGIGFNNSQAGSGFKEINGNKYIKLRKTGDAANTYNYSIRENGVIYDDLKNIPTDYSVDGDYRIKQNGVYLTQKQYRVYFQGTTLIEEKTNTDINMSVFYEDSLFRVLSTNYLVMKYSDDEGETWSDMHLLGKFRDPSQRNVLFGPGIGTQIKNGPYAGRMLVSAYNSISGDYGYLYSDDNGENWDFVNTSLGGSGNFAEAQIVEFPNGDLRTYMRTNVGKIGYITSVDGGMTWNSTSYIPDINVVSYGTQLAVINYSQQIDGKDAIIMSTPTTTNGRRAGKILIGLITDTGLSGYDKYSVNWTYEYEIDYATYGFSYSSLTELPNHDIGILYEKYDSWSRDELHLKNVMRYESYTIDELTN